MAAWVWAICRIIDVLEQTPPVQIDTAHIDVTGHTRYGKGALVINALEARIVLTILQFRR
jgi:hypothetical protein